VAPLLGGPGARGLIEQFIEPLEPPDPTPLTRFKLK